MWRHVYQLRLHLLAALFAHSAFLPRQLLRHAHNENLHRLWPSARRQSGQALWLPSSSSGTPRGAAMKCLPSSTTRPGMPALTALPSDSAIPLQPGSTSTARPALDALLLDSRPIPGWQHMDSKARHSCPRCPPL